MLRAEADENVVRKDFAPSEAVDIARVLRPLEERAAQERQGGPGRDRSGKLPEQSRARSRDRVAAAVGMSGRTLEKIEAERARQRMMTGKAPPAKFTEGESRQHVPAGVALVVESCHNRPRRPATGSEPDALISAEPTACLAPLVTTEASG